MSMEDQSSPDVPAPAPPIRAPEAHVSAAPAETNGFAITGLVLAFLMAPVGFVFSVIGLIVAARRGQKGKGLAITGLIVSIVIMICFGVGAVIVGQRFATFADPGCAEARYAIGLHKSEMSNPDRIKDAVRSTYEGLDKAAAKAEHDNVRDAITTIAADYRELEQMLIGNTAPTASWDRTVNAHGAAFDKLCSVEALT